jgi:hypothetical protein
MDTSENPARDPNADSEWRDFLQTMELDKVPGFWLVTGWPGGEVVLRLKIRHNYNQEPLYVFCEIRVGRGTEFTPITDFESCVYDLAHPDESDPYLYEELPDVWQSEFAEMARRWAACEFLLQFGSSELPRYPEEPASSRDAYESGAIG